MMKEKLRLFKAIGESNEDVTRRKQHHEEQLKDKTYNNKGEINVQ